MTKRFPAFALWRSTARFSREVLTPSTTSGRSRYSAPSPPTRRWCWRISKSTRNPTKFRRRKSFWKNSALRTASSRSTRCTVKKNVRGRGGCERASDRSAERKPVDLVQKRRGCVPRRHTPPGGANDRRQKAQSSRNADRWRVRRGGRRGRHGMGARCRRHHSGGAHGSCLPARGGSYQNVSRNLFLFVQPPDRRRASRRRHSQTPGHRKRLSPSPRRYVARERLASSRKSRQLRQNPPLRL